MSSPSRLIFAAKSSNIINLSNKNSWHSSYAPRRIIKAVGNKQTRPTSRAFAFNASVPLQVAENDYFRDNDNGMKTLPATARKTANFHP
jgi:hypothetical protein